MIGLLGRGRVLGGALCSIGGVALALAPFPVGEAQGVREASVRPPLVRPLAGPERRELEREADALSARFAPTFLQESSAEHPERDRPLSVDFDGDFRAFNNWEHLGPGSLAQKVTVYASAILTPAHAYLTYTLFYPRDWATPFCVPYVCHDNDLETALVVVSRGARSVLFVETKSHRSYLSVSGEQVRTDTSGRPLISVESEGHGMRVLERADRERAAGTHVYFHEASKPHEASGASEPYALASLYEALWSRRRLSAPEAGLWTEGETGPLYYSGVRSGRLGLPLGASMAGHMYRGGVRPPWALKAEVGARGDWFLDPAFVAQARHASWVAEHDASPTYELNPYLADLLEECVGPSCVPGAPERASMLSMRTALGALCLALGMPAWLPRVRRLTRRAVRVPS